MLMLNNINTYIKIINILYFLSCTYMFKIYLFCIKHISIMMQKQEQFNIRQISSVLYCENFVFEDI